MYLTPTSSVISNISEPTSESYTARSRLSLNLSESPTIIPPVSTSSLCVNDSQFDSQFSRTWRTQSLCSAKSPLGSEKLKPLLEAQSADVISEGQEKSKPVDVESLNELLTNLDADLTASTRTLHKFPQDVKVVGVRKRMRNSLRDFPQAPKEETVEELKEPQKDSESLIPPPKPPRPTTIHIEEEIKLDIDEIVRQCEETRAEIDQIGRPYGSDKLQLPDTIWPPTKSLRDSGIADLNSAVSPSAPEDPQPIVVPNFTYSISVDGPIENRSSTDEDSKKDEFSVNFAFVPVVTDERNSQVQRQSDSETDEELQVGSESSEDRCKSATDFSDAEIPPLPQSSAAGSVCEGERDEGFETESHSTACSERRPQSTEEQPSVTLATAEPKVNSTVSSQPVPSYLRGTKSSTFKVPTTDTGSTTTARPKDSGGFMQRLANVVKKPPVPKVTELKVSGKTQPSKSTGLPPTPSSATILARKSMAPRQMSSSSSTSSSPSPRQTNTILRKPPVPTQRSSLAGGSAKTSASSTPMVTRTNSATSMQSNTAANRMRTKAPLARDNSSSSDSEKQPVQRKAPPKRSSGTTSVSSTLVRAKPAIVADSANSKANDKRWERLMSPPKSNRLPTERQSIPATTPRPTVAATKTVKISGTGTPLVTRSAPPKIWR